MAQVYKDSDWVQSNPEEEFEKALEKLKAAGIEITPEILQQMRHAQMAGKWWVKGRNLTGNRNKQGDFIPAHKDLDNVTTDLTNPEVAEDPSIAANAELFDEQADYKRLKAKELHETRLAEQEAKSKSPMVGGDLNYSGQPELTLNKTTTDNIQEALDLSNSTKELEAEAGGDQTKAVNGKFSKEDIDLANIIRNVGGQSSAPDAPVALDQATEDRMSLHEEETAKKKQRKLGASQEALRLQEEEEDDSGFISWLSDLLGSGSGSREKGMLTKKHKSGQVAWGKGRGLYR